MPWAFCSMTFIVLGLSCFCLHGITANVVLYLNTDLHAYLWAVSAMLLASLNSLFDLLVIWIHINKDLTIYKTHFSYIILIIREGITQCIRSPYLSIILGCFIFVIGNWKKHTLQRRKDQGLNSSITTYLPDEFRWVYPSALQISLSITGCN